MHKSNRKILNFIDRFPFIIFILIGVAAFFIFTFIVNNLPLAFFSGRTEVPLNEDELSIFIASPINDREYELISGNETIAIDIKAKDIEDKLAVLKVFINDNEIRSFDNPPFEMSWNPQVSGTFIIHAQAMGKKLPKDS